MLTSAYQERRRGITRITIVLVCANLAVLFAMFSWSWLSYSHCPDFRSIAKSHMAMLADAVNQYAINVGKCPTTEQGLQALFVVPFDLTRPEKWKGPYLDKVQLPADPWNSVYHYEAVSDREFRIWSNGPDGASGTDDDISARL